MKGRRLENSKITRKTSPLIRIIRFYSISWSRSAVGSGVVCREPLAVKRIEISQSESFQTKKVPRV